MVRDDREQASTEAFEQGFSDTEKVAESVDKAFEQMAPSEFAREKSDELRQGSAELKEGGRKLEAMAESKVLSKTPSAANTRPKPRTKQTLFKKISWRLFPSTPTEAPAK